MNKNSKFIFMIKLVKLPLFVSYNSEAGATLSQEYLEPILEE